MLHENESNLGDQKLHTYLLLLEAMHSMDIFSSLCMLEPRIGSRYYEHERFS